VNNPADEEIIKLQAHRDQERAFAELNLAIGEAIQVYASVETAQAMVVEGLLRTDFKRAYAVFFAVQNIRSRNKLIETLLEIEFGDQLSKHWRSCAKFLEILANFRNAAAHWHPMGIIVLKPKGDTSPSNPYLQGIAHPVSSYPFRPLVPRDFVPFKKDCLFARTFLAELYDVVTRRPSPLPEKFQQPIAHRNLAVLQPRRTAKAPQPQRPPSVPKLSPAQMRAKARKDARERAKRKSS
jgi:hypothetical protein